VRRALAVLALGCTIRLDAAPPPRVPVLPQVKLPHNYYFREMYLPQLTAGPSSACWLPSGQELVVAMAGSLWRVPLDGGPAVQLTDDAATDHQPDCTHGSVVFSRYDGRAVELMRLDLASGRLEALTTGGEVNVEPKISPDGRRLAWVSTEGSGHLLLKTASLGPDGLGMPSTLTPDRRSEVRRYYYSPFDHAINPAWAPDGRALFFVSNREVAHGTGNLVRLSIDGGGEPQLVHAEETSWHLRPDVSPDGTRLVYSSYLGGQWNQLWVLPTAGGYPFPLTYGDHDATAPRFSPDGRSIAFVSNADGHTSLRVLDVFTGAVRQVSMAERRWRRPRRTLELKVVDEKGAPVAARVSLTDAAGRFHAPADSWIHADDMVAPGATVETRYVHVDGSARVEAPAETLTLTASRGPAHEVVRLTIDPSQAAATVSLKRLALPAQLASAWSGDLHVHMNYGGHYRNSPERLARQARAEGLDLVYNLIVNKEQRIPDIASFGADRTSAPLVLHGQEFHSSYWGHMGLLGLTKHLLLPDYTAYPYTGAASPFPHNAFIAAAAREQGALVGYVHPFDEDPMNGATLTNALPVDAALGRLAWYEAVGFADHRATSEAWYKLLECGLRLPAGAGTDAMANYASLRGPVGVNRVYVRGEGPLTRDSFLEALAAGRTMATNGPLLSLEVSGQAPGGTLRVDGPRVLTWRASVASNVPVDHLELVHNGKVVATLKAPTDEGILEVDGPGWILLRAWSGGPHPDVLDLYPFATTSPVYLAGPGGKARRSPEAAAYLLKWVARIREATVANPDYRTEAERDRVLADLDTARSFYEACGR
jgi:TolB protein